MLSTGTLNLRRFEKRPNELLVLEDLLDRRVTIEPGRYAGHRRRPRHGAQPQQRVAVTRVAVREHTGRLTRRGHVYQAEYDRVRGLIGPTDTQGTSNLLALLEQMRPADMANALQDLPDARRNEVAAALERPTARRRAGGAARARPGGDPGPAGPERAADVLERMDPDDAADLLAELPKAEQTLLLDLMEPDEAAPVRQLMNYRPGTAGSVMTSEPVILTAGRDGGRGAGPDPRAGAVPGRRRAGLRGPGAVATPSGKYLGMVHFQRLLREPPSSILGGIVDSDLDPLRPGRHAHRDHPADGDIRPGGHAGG